MLTSLQQQQTPFQPRFLPAFASVSADPSCPRVSLLHTWAWFSINLHGHNIHASEESTHLVSQGAPEILRGPALPLDHS